MFLYVAYAARSPTLISNFHSSRKNILLRGDRFVRG